MSSGDLISFLGDSEPAATLAPAKVAEAECSLPTELLDFDPLVSPAANGANGAPPSPSKGTGLPDAILAAFAKVDMADAAPQAAGRGEPLIGTWNFKRDPNALKEYDVQTIVERTKDGLRISEGAASGVLQESGEWFQASLATGIVRLRLTESHDIARDFKPSADAPWEGELTGHIGFNSKEAAALMSLGVGEAAARYQEQRAKEEE